MALAVVQVSAVTLRADECCPNLDLIELPGVSGIRAVFRCELVPLFPPGLVAGVVAST